MKYKNLGKKTIVIRLSKLTDSNKKWVTVKAGETVDLPQQVGDKYNCLIPLAGWKSDGKK